MLKGRRDHYQVLVLLHYRPRLTMSVIVYAKIIHISLSYKIKTSYFWKKFMIPNYIQIIAISTL